MKIFSNSARFIQQKQKFPYLVKNQTEKDLKKLKRIIFQYFQGEFFLFQKIRQWLNKISFIP